MPYEGRSARVDLSDIVGLRVPADHDEALIICYETMSCCGREIRYRVDWIIDEKTGKMAKLSHTVVLQTIGHRRGSAENFFTTTNLGTRRVDVLEI